MVTSKGIFDLAGEVAVVTGGAAGMGRAIASRLGEAGAQVVVIDMDEETPDLVAKHLPGAAYVVADLSHPHVHEDIVRRPPSRSGRRPSWSTTPGYTPR
jgi:3-oxoacyl-[acyl-carrier protein] reductase